VLAIQVGSSGLKTVMVQHGNYITLYSNLETLAIQKGERISLKQRLGKIHTDKVTGKTILKFQIWKDVQKENPKSWLLRL
jgi:septal ring factor EnvC (AmiA/AmiB activator)